MTTTVKMNTMKRLFKQLTIALSVSAGSLDRGPCDA
ncbi:MAG: hypothetical protein JWR50_1321 [Mucilaginibacter sp.]|nr:hypothetical protein [Mucilaginibacter sp.]